jgi:hypothetical protein
MWDIIKNALSYFSSENDKPKSKRSPIKLTPLNLKEYAKKMETSAKSDNTRVQKPIMSAAQANALKAKNDAAEIARRKQAIATSYAARNKPFSTKQLAEETGAIGDKLRLFPNDPDSFVDEYLNPGVMIGNMASGLGSLPEDVKKGRIGKAALSVVAPVLLGALGGLGGSKTKAQFLNEILNPAAGSGELISKLGGKKGASFIEKVKALKEWSPFYVPPEIKKLKDLHKGYVERFSTPEAKRRLIEGMGINPSDMNELNKPLLRFNPSPKNKNWLGYHALSSGSNQGLIDYIKRGESKMINLDMDQLEKYAEDPIGTYEHEIGHDLQTLAFLNSPEYKQILENYEKQKLDYEAYKKMSRSERKLITNKPTKPDKYSIMLPISKDTKHYYTETPIDKLIKKLDQLPLDELESSNAIFRKDYFNKGSYGTSEEGVAMLREMRHDMLSSGILKNEYDPVTPKMIGEYIAKYKNKDKVATFLRDNIKNRKILTEIFNKLPATGAGVATTLSLANQKNDK